MTPSLPPLIATYGSQSGAGNTTVCRWIEQFDYTVLRIDEPKEKLLIAFLQLYGLSVEDSMVAMHQKPWVRLSGLNISPAEMVQTLSDEWGRGCIHPDIWTMALLNRLKHAMSDSPRIVVDGIRYPYEYAMLNRMGFKFWRIHNPRAVESMIQHPHTGLLDGHTFDEFVDNTGTAMDLENRLLQLTGPVSEELKARAIDRKQRELLRARSQESDMGLTLTPQLETSK